MNPLLALVICTTILILLVLNYIRMIKNFELMGRIIWENGTFSVHGPFDSMEEFNQWKKMQHSTHKNGLVYEINYIYIRKEKKKS